MLMAAEIMGFLLTECDSVEELSAKQARSIWRDWHRACPLKKKRPHAILGETIVDRLLQATGRLNGRNAQDAYRRCDAPVLFVLTLDQLAGWRCECTSPPAVDSLDADLIVSPADFSWTFGTRKHEGRPDSDLMRFVYVEPDMDGSFPGDHLPTLW
jgi:hypothetical protein